MIYFLTGKDREKVLDKTKLIVKDNQGAEILNRGEFFEINEAIHFKNAIDLFGDTKIMLYDGALNNLENIENLLNIVDGLENSKNIFIFREEKLPKELESFVKKNKQSLFDFSVKEFKKSYTGNFALADAVASREKKQSWLLLRKAYDSGAVSEEIVGILFWKVRKLAELSKTKFSKKELVDFSKSLVSLYHEAHLGKVDFETGLEVLILKTI